MVIHLNTHINENEKNVKHRGNIYIYIYIYMHMKVIVFRNIINLLTFQHKNTNNHKFITAKTKIEFNGRKLQVVIIFVIISPFHCVT